MAGGASGKNESKVNGNVIHLVGVAPEAVAFDTEN
jgi:hypothetical protein